MIKPTSREMYKYQANKTSNFELQLIATKKNEKDVANNFDTVAISNEAFLKLNMQRSQSSEEWEPEFDDRVTSWIREHWDSFVQLAEQEMVKKSIQTVIGLFFKELSRKTGGIIGDLVSPEELNSGEDIAIIAWRMEQKLAEYLGSRPSMCLDCGVCSHSPVSECPTGVFGF